jgi:glycerol uptake facilitator-like aquaporin
MKKNGIFGELVAEVFGTFILVLLGVGVVANVGLAPRIFATLIGSQGTFDGIYWLVAPVIGPMIGGVAGIVLYDLCVTPFLPTEEKVASEQLKAVAEPA